MTKYDKLLTKVLEGKTDSNINFHELCVMLERFGFEKRIRGDHFIFSKNDIMEIINIQPKGNKAKPYQVKQIREIFLKYKLGETNGC